LAGEAVIKIRSGDLSISLDVLGGGMKRAEGLLMTLLLL
jgi:hypothetical protein